VACKKHASSCAGWASARIDNLFIFALGRTAPARVRVSGSGKHCIAKTSHQKHRAASRLTPYHIKNAVLACRRRERLNQHPRTWLVACAGDMVSFHRTKSNNGNQRRTRQQAGASWRGGVGAIWRQHGGSQRGGKSLQYQRHQKGSGISGVTSANGGRGVSYRVRRRRRSNAHTAGINKQRQ